MKYDAMIGTLVVESVARIRLDRGGYTSTGRYFGSGAPLFEIQATRTTRSDFGEETAFRSYFVRAAGRAAAIREVIKAAPRSDFLCPIPRECRSPTV